MDCFNLISDEIGDFLYEENKWCQLFKGLNSDHYSELL